MAAGWKETQKAELLALILQNLENKNDRQKQHILMAILMATFDTQRKTPEKVHEFMKIGVSHMKTQKDFMNQLQVPIKFEATDNPGNLSQAWFGVCRCLSFLSHFGKATNKAQKAQIGLLEISQ